MVCGDEVKEDAAQALGTDDPPTDSTWDGRDYTCTYHLPDGPMTLTVHVAADAAAARTRYDQVRTGLPGVQDMAGLGEAAYGTGDGLVVVRKDAFVLQVDTTALPPVFGANGQRRSALAFEMASVILGCWTHG